MKRTLMFLLCFSIIFSGFFCEVKTVKSAETVYDEFPSYGNSENKGIGAFSGVVSSGGVAYNSSNQPILCWMTQGGYFYAYNYEEREIVLKVNVTEEFGDGYITCHGMTTASDGNLYFVGYSANNIKKYNPVTNELTRVAIGKIPSSDITISSIEADSNGKIFMGSYSATDAKLLEYDIATDTVINWGVISKGSKYCQGISVDDDYIYCALGINDYKCAVVIDRSQMKKNNSLIAEKFIAGSDLTLSNGITSINIYDDVIAVVSGALYVYNRNTLRPVNAWSSGKPKHLNANKTDLSTYNKNQGNLIYSMLGSNLYKYDSDTNKQVIVKDLSKVFSENTTDYCIMPWMKLSTGEEIIPIVTNQMKELVLYNSSDESYTKIIFDETDLPAKGPNIQSLEIMPGKDIMYIGGYQNSMSVWDVKTETFIQKVRSWTQNEGVGFMNGKAYLGTYTGAVIWRHDPDSEWNYNYNYNYDLDYSDQYMSGRNPAVVLDIEDKQDRPFVLKEYNDKLYIGTFPAYAEYGGALVIYSENESGEPNVELTYRNIIEDQAITGIAFKDNLCYVSSSIRCGLGAEPTETQAKIAVLNLDTNKVERTIIPDLPAGVGTTSKTIGEISIGPDGLLWGCSEKEGLVFALDPDTFECVKYVALNPENDLGALARPLYLRWSPDGLLYTTAGWDVSVINPETMQYKKIVSDCSLMTLDTYGNIWYAKGNAFFRMPVNYYGKLTNVINGLSLGNCLQDETYDNIIAAKNSVNENSSLEEIEEAITTVKTYAPYLKTSRNYMTDFSATVDYIRQAITVSFVPTLSESISIVIDDPSGNMVYMDVFTGAGKQRFEKSYRLAPLKEGEYKINITGKSYSETIVKKLDVAPPVMGILASRNNIIQNGILKSIVRLSNYNLSDDTVLIISARIHKANKTTSEITFDTKTVKAGDYLYYTIDYEDEDDSFVRTFVWNENYSPLTD